MYSQAKRLDVAVLSQSSVFITSFLARPRSWFIYYVVVVHCGLSLGTLLRTTHRNVSTLETMVSIF